MWIQTLFLALFVGIACGSVRRPHLIRVPRETPAYTYHQPSSDERGTILREITRVAKTEGQDQRRVLTSGSVIDSAVTSNQRPVAAVTRSREPLSVITRSQEPLSAITSSQEPISGRTNSREPAFTVANSPTTSSALTNNHRAIFDDAQTGKSHGPTTEWPPIPPYHFAFQVQDSASNNFQNRVEFVENGLLQGSFSLLSPDGIVRTSIYSDDGTSGFTVSQRENVADIGNVSGTSSTTAARGQDSFSSRSSVGISTSDGPSETNAGSRGNPSNRGLTNAGFQSRLGVASDNSGASLSLGALATEKVGVGRAKIELNGGPLFSTATSGVFADSLSSIRSANISDSRNLNGKSGTAVIGTFTAAQSKRNFNFNEESTSATRSESPITVKSSPSTPVFSQGIRLSDLLNIVFSSIGLFGVSAHKIKPDFQISSNPTAINRASNLDGVSEIEKILIVSEAFSPAGVSSGDTAPSRPKDDKNIAAIDPNKKSSRRGFGNDQSGFHDVSASITNHHLSRDTGTRRVPAGSIASSAVQLTTDSITDNVDSVTKASRLNVDPNEFSTRQEHGSISGSSSNGVFENSNIRQGGRVSKATPTIISPPTELSVIDSDSSKTKNVVREFSFQKSPHLTQEVANQVASSPGPNLLRSQRVLSSSNGEKGFHSISVTSTNPSMKGFIVAGGLSSGAGNVITGSESEGSTVGTQFIHDSIIQNVLFSNQPQGHGKSVNLSDSVPRDIDSTKKLPIPSALTAASSVSRIPISTSAATSDSISVEGIENSLKINKGNQRLQEAVNLDASSRHIDSLNAQSVSLTSNGNNGSHAVLGATTLRQATTSNPSSFVEINNNGGSNSRVIPGRHTLGSITHISTSVGASANNIGQTSRAAIFFSAIGNPESGAAALTKEAVSDVNISAAGTSHISVGSRSLSNRRSSESLESTSNTANISANRNGNLRTPVAKAFTATSSNQPAATRDMKDSTVNLSQSAPHIGVDSTLFSNRRAPEREISKSIKVSSSNNNNDRVREQATKTFTASCAAASRASKLTSESTSDFIASAAKVRDNGIRSRLFSNRQAPRRATSDIASINAPANRSTRNRVLATEDFQTVSTAGSSAGRLTGDATLNNKDSDINIGQSVIRSRLLNNRRITENSKFAREPASKLTGNNNNQGVSVHKSSITLSKEAPVRTGPSVVNSDSFANRKEMNTSDSLKDSLIRPEAISSLSHLKTDLTAGSTSLQSNSDTGFTSISTTAPNLKFTGNFTVSEGPSVAAESVTSLFIAGSDSESNSPGENFNQDNSVSRLAFKHQSEENTKSLSFQEGFSTDNDTVQSAPRSQAFIATSSVPRVSTAGNGVVVGNDATVIHRTLSKVPPSISEDPGTNAGQETSIALILDAGQVALGAEQSTNEKVHSSSGSNDQNHAAPRELQRNLPFSAGIAQTTVIAEPHALDNIHRIGLETQEPDSPSLAKSDSGVEQFAFVFHSSNDKIGKDTQHSLPSVKTSTTLGDGPSLPSNFQESIGITSFSNKQNAPNGHGIQTALDVLAPNSERQLSNSQHNIADLQFSKSIPPIGFSSVFSTAGLNAGTTGLNSGVNKPLASISASALSLIDESLQRSSNEEQRVAQTLSSISTASTLDATSGAAAVSAKESSDSLHSAGASISSGNTAGAQFLNRKSLTGVERSSAHKRPSAILSSNLENIAKESIRTANKNIQANSEDVSRTRTTALAGHVSNLNTGELNQVLLGDSTASIDPKSTADTHVFSLNDLNQPPQISHGAPSFILIVEDSSTQMTGTTENAGRLAQRANNALISQDASQNIPSSFSSRTEVVPSTSNMVPNTEAPNSNRAFKVGETIARGAHFINSERVSMSPGLSSTSRITGRPNKTLNPSVSSQSSIVKSDEKGSQTTAETSASLHTSAGTTQQLFQSSAADFVDNRTPSSALKQRTPPSATVFTGNNQPKVTSSLSDIQFPTESHFGPSSILNQKSRESSSIAKNSPSVNLESIASTSRLHSSARDLVSNHENIRISSTAHQGSDALKGSSISTHISRVTPQRKLVSNSSPENSRLLESQKASNLNEESTSMTGHGAIISHVISSDSGRESSLGSSAINQERANTVQAADISSKNFVAGADRSGVNIRDNTRLGLNSDRSSGLSRNSVGNRRATGEIGLEIIKVLSASSTSDSSQTSSDTASFSRSPSIKGGQMHKVTVNEPNFSLMFDDSQAASPGVSNSNIDRFSGLFGGNVRDQINHFVSSDHRTTGENGLEFTRVLSSSSTGDSSQNRANSANFVAAPSTGGQEHKVVVTEPSSPFKFEDSQAISLGSSDSDINRSSGLSRSSVRDKTTHSGSANIRTVEEESLELTKSQPAISSRIRFQTSANIASSLKIPSTESHDTVQTTRKNEPTFAALVGNPEITSQHVHAVSNSARSPGDIESGPRSQIPHFTIANHKFLSDERRGQGEASVFTSSSLHDSSASRLTPREKEQQISIFSLNSNRSVDPSNLSLLKVSGENTSSQRQASAQHAELQRHNGLQGLNTDNAHERLHGFGSSTSLQSFSNSRNTNQLSALTSGSQFRESIRTSLGGTNVLHGSNASAGGRVILENPNSSGDTGKIALSESAKQGSGDSTLGTSDASSSSITFSHGNAAPNFGRVSTSASTISGFSLADLLTGSSKNLQNQRPSDDQSFQSMPSGNIVFSLGGASGDSFNEKTSIASRIGLPVSVTNLKQQIPMSTAFPKSDRSQALNTGTLVSADSHITVPSSSSVAKIRESKSFEQEGVNGQTVKAVAQPLSSIGLNLAPLARSSGKLSLSSQGSNTAVGTSISKSVAASNDNRGTILVGEARRSSLTSTRGDIRSAENHKLSNDKSGLDLGAVSITHGSGFSQRALNIGTSKTSDESGISNNAAFAATNFSSSTKSRVASSTSFGRGTTGEITINESNKGFPRLDSERGFGSSLTSVTSSVDRTLTIISNKPEAVSRQSSRSTVMSPSSSAPSRISGVNSGNDEALREASKSSVAQSVTGGILRKDNNDSVQRKPLPSGKSSVDITSDIRTGTITQLDSGIGRFATSSNRQESSVSLAGSSVGVPPRVNIKQNLPEISKSHDTLEAGFSAKTDGIGSIIALGTHVDNSHKGSLVRMQARVPKFISSVTAAGLSSRKGEGTLSDSPPANGQRAAGSLVESSSSPSNNSFARSRAGSTSRSLGDANITGDRKSLISTSDTSSSQNSAPSNGPFTSLAGRWRSGISVSSQDNSKLSSIIGSTGTASENLESQHLPQGTSQLTSLLGRTNSLIAARIGVPVNVPGSFPGPRSLTS